MGDVVLLIMILCCNVLLQWSDVDDEKKILILYICLLTFQYKLDDLDIYDQIQTQ